MVNAVTAPRNGQPGPHCIPPPRTGATGRIARGYAFGQIVRL